MKTLEQQLNELEKKLPLLTLKSVSVSQAPVAWHLAHTLLTISQIILVLKRSNPSDFKKQFSLLKLIVFTTNKIPRGKAKAPQNVEPNEEISREYLQKNLARTRNLIAELTSMDAKSHFKHPVFKTLDLKSATKFLIIHTEHHLAIINDIQKGSS